MQRLARWALEEQRSIGHEIGKLERCRAANGFLRCPTMCFSSKIRYFSWIFQEVSNLFMKVLRLFFTFWDDVLNTNLVTLFCWLESFQLFMEQETSAFFETKKLLGGSQTRWRFFLWKISWRSLTWHCEATIFVKRKFRSFLFFCSRKMDGVDPTVVGFKVHWSFRNQKDFYFFPFESGCFFLGSSN